jgi:flagellar protein FlbD
MIKLTRLNNQPLVVNSDLIKSVENSPDTVLTLVTGEKIIVRETTEQVLERVIAFRRAILANHAPSCSNPEQPAPALQPSSAEGTAST